MSQAHAEAIEVEVETALHRAAPETKVLALVAFAIAVALVPRGVAWPYAVDLVLLAALALWARAPLGTLARRLVVELPFLLVVVALPFTAGGPQTDVLGLGLSVAGIEAAWGVAAKATLVVLATGVLAATTPAPAILAGLERLHVPRQLTAIGAFAIRYLQVVMDELRRLSWARRARGDDPRWLWQARAVGRSAGALAIRTLERGERVHGAMLARGWDGRMPGVAVAPRARLPLLVAGLAVALPAWAAALIARGAAL